MERTEVNVTAKISLHDVLNALALLANVYPMERVAEYQIERIEASARVLRERMKDYEEEKAAAATKQARESLKESLSTAIAGVDLQWTSSSSAKTVMNRRMGPITRRKHNTKGSPFRRFGKGRRKDDVGYSGLPYADLTYSAPLLELRVGPSCRRKVYDLRNKQYRRNAGNFGRRKSDTVSCLSLPKIEERRGYNTTDRRKVTDASSKHLRRTLNMYGRRIADKTPYNAYPIVNEMQPVEARAYVERRVNAPSRRKVNDWAHPNRTRRIASYGPSGRRSTDRDSYTMLPIINDPEPELRCGNGPSTGFTKKKK